MKNVIQIDSSRPLRLLQLTDLHLGVADNLRPTLQLVDDAISITKPDFVAVTGDLSWAQDTEDIFRRFCACMDVHRIPWGFCFGNHDRDRVRDPRCLENILEADPYCTYGNDDLSVFGYGNYAVTFTDAAGAPLHVFYFFDNTSPHHYDGLRHLKCGSLSQNRWFRENQRRLKKNGDRFCTWVFLHYPLREYTEMWKTTETHGPRVGEESGSPVNTGLFCTLAEDKFVKGVFCGHEHGTCYSGEYYGVKLLFGRSTGFCTSKGHISAAPYGCRVCDLFSDGTIQTFFVLEDGSFRDADNNPLAAMPGAAT